MTDDPLNLMAIERDRFQKIADAKGNDDWWVAKRNINMVVGATTIERIKEIAEKI